MHQTLGVANSSTCPTATASVATILELALRRRHNTRAQTAQLELGGRATPPVVTPPLAGSSSMVVTSPTLQADKITAQEVRANTIYANRIDADRIQGVVYQTGGVTMNSANSIGDIRAPQVTASVIYADQIRAGDVSADTIYVRNLRQH